MNSQPDPLLELPANLTWCTFEKFSRTAEILSSGDMKSSSGALERWCAVPLSLRTVKAGPLPPAKPRAASLGWTTWERDGRRAKELWELDTLPPVEKKNPRNWIELSVNHFRLVKFNTNSYRLRINENKKISRGYRIWLPVSLKISSFIPNNLADYVN